MRRVVDVLDILLYATRTLDAADLVIPLVRPDAGVPHGEGQTSVRLVGVVGHHAALGNDVGGELVVPPRPVQVYVAIDGEMSALVIGVLEDDGAVILDAFGLRSDIGPDFLFWRNNSSFRKIWLDAVLVVVVAVEADTGAGVRLQLVDTGGQAVIGVGVRDVLQHVGDSVPDSLRAAAAEVEGGGLEGGAGPTAQRAVGGQVGGVLGALAVTEGMSVEMGQLKSKHRPAEIAAQVNWDLNTSQLKSQHKPAEISTQASLNLNTGQLKSQHKPA